MTNELDRELALHRRRERERERNRRIDDDAIALLIELGGGMNRDKPSQIAPQPTSAHRLGAELQTRRALLTQYTLGRQEGLIEGGHRMLEWLRSELMRGADLQRALEYLDPKTVVFEPEDRETEAVFQLRREAAALHYALSDANVRGVRASHRRIGELLDEVRSLKQSKPKPSRRRAQAD